MAVLLVACLLAAFLPEGNSISCQTCHNAEGLSCQGKVTPCAAPYDTCIGHYAETTEGGTVVASNFQIDCGESKSCNAIYSVQFGPVYTTSGSSCCTTDGCTPTIPSHAAKNGLSCPACFTAASDSCDPWTNMECSGLENKCIRYTVKTTLGLSSTQVAFRGCATGSYCAYGNYSSPTTSFTTICTDATTKGQGKAPQW